MRTLESFSSINVERKPKYQVSHPQFLSLSAGCVVEKPIKCSRPE